MKNLIDIKGLTEKYELVNINGNGTGEVITNLEFNNKICIPEGKYIPVVGVVIVNDKNEILLQKRSNLKKINPGKWGICGGKVDLGETPLEAAIRETFEEIGISLNMDELKLLSIFNGKNVYFTTYYIKSNIDINKCKLQKEEVEELKYFKIEQLQSIDHEGFEWLENLKEIL